MNKEQELAILKQRAAKLAESIPQVDKSQDVEYVLFLLSNGQEYGVAYSFVEGIIKPEVIARVPCAPPAILGVVNWHGALLTVADLNLLLEVTAQESTIKRPWIIVVQFGGKHLGLLVEALTTNRSFSTRDLRVMSQESPYIQGTIQENIAILNVGALFSTRDLLF